MHVADGLQIVEYSPRYARPLVEMWRASFERAVGVMDAHSIEEQIAYLENKVVPENRVGLVLDGDAVVGFSATTDSRIAQLYLHIDYQGRGIGSRLMHIAKEESNGCLRLFTFKANEGAQHFYEAHGFRIVARGFEEMWGLEDIEYEWRAESAG